MPKNKEQQCSTYEKVGMDYLHVKEIDRALTSLVIKPDFIFCDVGGGSGIDALPLCHKAEFGICLDINRNKLRDGLERAKRQNLKDRIDFLRGSATNLPLRGNMLDLII